MERFSDQWPFGLPTCRTFDHSDQCTIFGPTFGPTIIRNIELSPKIQVEGYGQGQIWWSHLRSRFQSICLLFIMWQPDHFWQRYSKFCIWPWKFQGQCHSQGQIWWSHLRPRIRSTCLLFVSRQPHHFWLRYSKFHIWPWKFKVQVTAKVGQNLIR